MLRPAAVPRSRSRRARAATRPAGTIAPSWVTSALRASWKRPAWAPIKGAGLRRRGDPLEPAVQDLRRRAARRAPRRGGRACRGAGRAAAPRTRLTCAGPPGSIMQMGSRCAAARPRRGPDRGPARAAPVPVAEAGADLRLHLVEIEVADRDQGRALGPVIGVVEGGEAVALGGRRSPRGRRSACGSAAAGRAADSPSRRRRSDIAARRGCAPRTG